MADVFIARLGEIAIKVETTKGTKLTPAVDGTESKIRVYDVVWTPDISKHDRKLTSIALSRYSHTIGTTYGKLAFKIDLRKTAITATDDAWYNLLRACGMAFNTGTGAWTFTSNQTTHKTLTMLCWLCDAGGASTAVRVGMRGAMGNVSFNGKVGERPQLMFEFNGIHEVADVDLKPQDDGLNSITHENAVPSAFHSVALTWNGNTRRASTVTWNANNVIVPREDVSSSGGALHFALTDRGLTGTIDPDMEAVATEDFWGQHNLGTEVAVAWTYTQPATASPAVNARTFAFSIPKAQVVSIAEGDRNGIAVANLDFAADRNTEAGDDEFTMTITGV